MSKSSSSKVYFVLYLAVILELLIIIVERDEAEDLFFKRQKELEEQVATLLIFMNPSAVSEPINVSQRGLIVFDDQQPDPQGYKRRYTVNVAVNNPAMSSTIAEKIQRGNVRDMQYYVLTYQSSQETDAMVDAEWQRIGTQRALGQLARATNKEHVVLQDSLGKPTRWVLKAHRRLALDEAGMLAQNQWQNPVYALTANVGSVDTYAPKGAEKSFAYAPEESDTKDFRRRTFAVEFLPDRGDVPLDQGNGNQALHCKLLFASLADNVVGVSADGNAQQSNDDQKVNVGGMPIRLGLLRTMQASSYEECKRYGVPSPEQAQTMSGDEFARTMAVATQAVQSDVAATRNSATTMRTASLVSTESNATTDEPKQLRAVKLYEYITKLMTPSFARNFEQNRGVTAIDVKVMRKSSAKPTLDVYATNTAGFAGSGVNAVLEGISSTDIQKLRATIKTEQGAIVPSANIKIVPMNSAVASAGATGTTKGQSWYAAISNLQSGTYTFEMTDGVNTDRATVAIFAPSAEPQKAIANWMVGGKVVSVRLNTPDGTIIPENQFVTTVELAGQKPQSVSGKTVNVPCIPATAQRGEAKVQLKWVEPHTGQAVIVKEWVTTVLKEEPYIAPQNLVITAVNRQGDDPDHQYMVELKLQVADVRVDADCATGTALTAPVNVRVQSVQTGSLRGRIVSQSKQSGGNGVSTYLVKVEFNGEQYDKRDKSKPLSVALTTDVAGSTKSHTLGLALR